MSLPIADATPYAAVAIALLGFGVVVVTASVSAVSKSPTSTFEWLQQVIDLRLSPSNYKCTTRKPESAAVVVHSPRQRHSVAASSSSVPGPIAEVMAIVSKTESKMQDYGTELSETNAVVSQIEMLAHEHTRTLHNHNRKLVLHSMRHEESDRKHDTSNRRHDNTEEAMKEIQQTVVGVKQEVQQQGTSIILLSVLFAAVVFGLTSL